MALTVWFRDTVENIESGMIPHAQPERGQPERPPAPDTRAKIEARDASIAALRHQLTALVTILRRKPLPYHH